MSGHIFFFHFFLAVCLVGLTQAQTMIRKGLSCVEKRLATDFHNELRRKVANGTLAGQPKASHMQKLVWDDALALTAQNWANKMNFEHNLLRSDPRFKTGENIGLRSTTSSVDISTFDIKTRIQSWYDENKAYTYQQLKKGTEVTGHYTQIVAAKTKYVGCGASYFKNTDGKFTKFYVCNYGPEGIIAGQYPYIKGAGCVKLCCSDQCAKPYGKNC